MPVPRLLSVFLSVLFSVGLWFYGLSQTGAVKHSGYAALVCGEAVSDREIRDRLDGQGLTGLVSESDQWFYLDCFGSVEKIPLVEYEDRLLPFDPRNDGYAEKLKSLFVRDGKRFVYIPLGINSSESMEMKAAHALTGISYSFEYAHAPKQNNTLFYFLMFCLSVCVFLVVPVLCRRLNSGMVSCLLALSPLAIGKAPGFALAALLVGFASLLAKPGRNVWSGRYGGQRQSLPKPFTAQWFLAFALIACYVFFSFFCGLGVLFTFLVLASFFCAFALSFERGNPHRPSIRFDIKRHGGYTRRGRFIPVEIISGNTSNYGFFTMMLPFAIMAAALVFVGLAGPASPPPVSASPLPAGTVTESDFREHFLFQSAFSYRALGKTYEGGGLPPVIAAYELASNGLLEPAPPDIYDDLRIPDFPLVNLLRGLVPDSPGGTERRNRSPAVIDLASALFPFIFILPAFAGWTRKKKHGKSGAGFGGFFR
jgi:hypothetical protein